ncbi:MAG TPA: hypothetical protein EYP22_07215 [Methanosarcinales archaeon]|nr:hypothetical protein [Methanosarcinales archaeon]
MIDLITNLKATEAILAVIVYMLAGAFVLFIYSAYEKTKQRSLLILATGLFIMIFGSNFDTFSGIFLTNYFSYETSRVLALIIEIPGIILMLYSAIKS